MRTLLACLLISATTLAQTFLTVDPNMTGAGPWDLHNTATKVRSWGPCVIALGQAQPWERGISQAFTVPEDGLYYLRTAVEIPQPFRCYAPEVRIWIDNNSLPTQYLWGSALRWGPSQGATVVTLKKGTARMRIFFEGVDAKYCPNGMDAVVRHFGIAGPIRDTKNYQCGGIGVRDDNWQQAVLSVREMFVGSNAAVSVIMLSWAQGPAINIPGIVGPFELDASRMVFLVMPFKPQPIALEIPWPLFGLPIGKLPDVHLQNLVMDREPPYTWRIGDRWRTGY